MWISCIGRSELASAAESGHSPAQSLGDQVASLRLIAEAGPTNGRYRAGIDIAMQAGAHTYWKQPGDAGVPPVFSFNGSQNVASAEVTFPTPVRINEGGIEAFGYADHVVFPVAVTPKEAGRPAILKVDVAYAVCRKICIPAHGAATITLAPGGAAVAARQVVEAIADVPAPATPAERHALAFAPVKGASKPSWTLTWSGEAIDDVFADAPEGYYFETKKLAADKFLLTASQVVTATKTTSVPVTLTLARKSKGLFLTESLDVSNSTN